jgi:signal transduction histidine kinase
VQTIRELMERSRRWSPLTHDAVLAGVLVVACVTVTVANASRPDPPSRGPAPDLAVSGLVLVVLVAGAVAVRWRRQFPTTVLAVAVTGHLMERWLVPGQNVGWLSVWVALYSLGAHTTRRRALTGWLATCLAYAGVGLVVPDMGLAQNVQLGGQPLAGTGILNDAVTFGGITLLGAYVQTRRAYRSELVARAILDERGRIARELHDVVAHHLSGMVVQAGAAELLIDRDPQRARAMLADIRTNGKHTLTSMRRLIGILRAGDDPVSVAPQPGLDQLDAIVSSARVAGVTVDVAVEGQTRTLPDAVNIAAARILQEALTNVRKHAPGATARALVRYGVDDVVIRVSDGGPGTSGVAEPAEAEPSSGIGLIGMRERTMLLGGQFQAGPASDGGWLVQARLPIQPQEAEPAHPGIDDPAAEERA